MVAFDLRETRVSAAEAAVYVKPNEIADYAAGIVDLLDDEPRRPAMGELGGPGSRESWPGATRNAPTSTSTAGCSADERTSAERSAR